MGIYSTPAQLNRIAQVLSKYVRLPFSGDTIPGAIMEGVIAHVRDAERCNTYDFVDVIDRKNGLGWQVKSTKASTPVTWKRAKIPGSQVLVDRSLKSAAGCQTLGNAIIAFCNEHARASLALYHLSEIGYARLVVKADGAVVYFERLLCTAANPQLFDPADFEWHWSKPKNATKKEQLQALHGIHKASGRKWWAWHGLGENQLHFSGEDSWWPDSTSNHSATFQLPSDRGRLTIEDFLVLLDRA
jgi:ribosomal protein L24E